VSKRSESTQRHAPVWSNENIFLSPWNAVTFLATFAGIKWLCGLSTPAAYGTASGNVQIAGILMLGAITAALLCHVGSDIFKVPRAYRSHVFWFPGIWVVFGPIGAAAFVIRAFMIAKGAIPLGLHPPGYLEWLFAPSVLAWFTKIGSV
jgi:hypothetical protein